MNNSENKMTEDIEDNKMKKIDLDTIFANEIGQFGKFQFIILGLAAVIAVFVSLSSNEYVFTTSRIPTRCRIPECDDSDPIWSPDWLPNAIPATGTNTFDFCQRFANTSALLRQINSDICPSTLFNRNSVQNCEEYVYQNTHTIASDFGLACDEWRRSLIGTIRILGTFIGLPITGLISDNWGRRVALSLTAVNRFWMGILRYWAKTYIGFMMSEFFEAIVGAGCFACAYTLVLEYMGSKYRVVGGALMNTFFSIGQVFMGLIAWGVPNWRHLTLAIYIPQVLLIFYYWVMSESVRWYMSKGRFDDSEATLKRIAKVNNRQISERTLQVLRDTAMEKQKQKALQEECKPKEPLLIMQLFQHRRILLRVLVSPVWWFTTTLVYYGLSINAVNLTGHRYLNYIAVSAVEIPGYWTAVFLMEKIGRRTVLISAFWVCATFQIAYIFLPADQYVLSLIVYLIAKFAIAVVMTTIYVYTNELYPTKHRQILFSYNSMIGRIGSMVAPLTPAIGVQWFQELPFALFAGFALLSGALAFTTPETLGSKLPDTFEEANRIGLKEDIKN